MIRYQLAFSTMRDNFPRKVIRELERRVNSKCSNPQHRAPTSGPTAENGQSINIGIAAHICAASVGGPRFNSKMTREERSSIQNGIWLCQNCAGLIDRDTKTYTVELLEQWKTFAENRAKEELGQIPISREHFEAMQSLVFGTTSTHGRGDPVANMCRVAAESLERKDPRFKVEVERSGGLTTYTYQAREVVEGLLSVKSNFAAEFSEKLTLLLQHGQELKIASNAIIFEGSPLFEQFQGANGTFVIGSANRKPASVLIELASATSGNRFFAEIEAIISAGSESLCLQGKGLGGLFDLELILPKDSTKVRINSTFDFAFWDGMEVTRLPHFDRAWSYYECARDSRTINLTIEVEGNQLARMEGTIPIGEIGSLAILPYVKSARALTAACAEPIRYRSKVRIPWNHFQMVNELRLKTELSDPKDLASNPTMTLSPPPGKSLQHVQQYIASSTGALKIEQECDGLVLFDQTVPPFKLVTTFSSARLQAIGHPRKRSVTAAILPLEGCSIKCYVEKSG